MPWIRIDEEFTRHPKVVQAGPLGIAMQVAGLCYCNQNLTDGFIPRAIARTLLDWSVEDAGGQVWTLAITGEMTGHDVDSELVIDLMVGGGIWDRVAGGFRIHDYHDYQPTKADVLAEREQKREAGRRGGLASAKAKQARAQAPATATAQAGAQAERQAESNPVPVPVIEPPSVQPVARPPENGRTDEQVFDYQNILKEMPA